MPGWRLCPDVHLADVCGDIVFLDARGNAYSCVPRSRASAIQELLADDGAMEDEELSLLAGELAAAGLVCRGAAQRPAPPGATAMADYHDIAPAGPKSGVATWLRLALAAIETAVKLGLGRPAGWLRHRAPRDEAFPATRACALALQFDRLRIWIPRSGRCLPASLMLLGFLRRHGLAASLIFGVRTFPFEAHCWVEYRGFVLNDTLEHVRWFTPIAAA